MLQTNVLRRVAIALVALALGACTTSPGSLRTGAVMPTVPEVPDRSAHYAIYMHDVALDRSPDDAERRARFNRVLKTLASNGLIVVAEVRPAGTIQKVPEDLDRYAQKVAGQVRQLLAAGVPARQINVIGYSRGATLTLMTAGYVANSSIGYVVIAGCMTESGSFKQFAPMLSRYAEKLTGQFLSIAEQSDADFGSCAPYFAKAAARPTYAETILQTGKGHAFAMEPDEAWVRPTISWIIERR
jgi:hypothetical protein